MNDGKYNTDTGKMGDTCSECKGIVHETLVEMSDGYEGMDYIGTDIDDVLDETPMFTDDPEIN